MKFEYEGTVILGCQEGGNAAPEILLAELPGGVPRGVTRKVRAVIDGDQPKTLDEVLAELFGPGPPNRYGDRELGRRVRIVVEAL